MPGLVTLSNRSVYVQVILNKKVVQTCKGIRVMLSENNKVEYVLCFGRIKSEEAIGSLKGAT